MEINNPYWNNPEHPNYNRWLNGRLNAKYRAEFVSAIIQNNTGLGNKTVLDIGSGLGGTVYNLDHSGNTVISLDIALDKLKKQDKADNISLMCADGRKLPIVDSSIDIVILQDVIEHVPDVKYLISEVHRVLKNDGIVYISSPNKLSVINIFADPHWGLPLVSLMNRNMIKSIVLKHFRKSEYNRDEFAALLSLAEIFILFDAFSSVSLQSKFAVSELFKGNRGIIWTASHLRWLKFIKFMRFDRLYIKWFDDKPGFMNKYIIPNFYIITKK